MKENDHSAPAVIVVDRILIKKINDGSIMFLFISLMFRIIDAYDGSMSGDKYSQLDLSAER